VELGAVRRTAVAAKSLIPGTGVSRHDAIADVDSAEAVVEGIGDEDIPARKDHKAVKAVESRLDRGPAVAAIILAAHARDGGYLAFMESANSVAGSELRKDQVTLRIEVNGERVRRSAPPVRRG